MSPTQFWKHAIDQTNVTTVIRLCMSKAFDSINHMQDFAYEIQRRWCLACMLGLVQKVTKREIASIT